MLVKEIGIRRNLIRFTMLMHLAYIGKIVLKKTIAFEKKYPGVS
jgi:hypothetical protein